MPGSRPLIVLHGLWLGRWALGRLRRNLSGAGRDSVHLFSWPTLSEGLETNATRLRRFAEGLGTAGIDWIGHSLGGVLILKTLAGWDARPPGRIVCLGSPLAGSVSAARLARVGPGRRIIGPSILEGVLASSAADWCPAALAAETGVIAGTRGMGAGRILGHIERPHDGTVRVAETRLPGAADHLTLDVSHTGLLFSRRAASAAAAFLDTGRFPAPPIPS